MYYKYYIFDYILYVCQVCITYLTNWHNLFLGEKDGYNIPEVKSCPEVERYLNMPLAELAKQVPREMDGVAKRLFCDGYMYLYQSPTMALYRWYNHLKQISWPSLTHQAHVVNSLNTDTVHS